MAEDDNAPNKRDTLPTDFDRLLKMVGDSGVYQVTLFLLISVMEFVAIDSFSINFIAARMDHWCHVAPVDNCSFDEQRLLTIPPSAKDVGFSKCLRYNHIGVAVNSSLNCSIEAEGRSYTNITTLEIKTVKCDDGWTYDRSLFASSIVSEWDLVCDRAWMVDLVSSIYMVGRLVASMTGGIVADRFGRKPTVLIFHAVKMIGSIICVYAPNFTTFVISRFIIAVGSTASNLATFLIVNEVSGNKYRSTFAIGWSLMLSIGAATMPGISYFVRDWRTLQSIYTWPQIALFAYVLLLDESPRWLMVKRKVRESTIILTKIAEINRRHLSQDIVVDVQSLPAPVIDQRKSKCWDCSIKKLVATPFLRKWSLILWLNWFTGSLMYYALSLNAGRLPGDVFINMFLLAVVEIPANIIAVPLLERAGRRLTLSISMLLAGISSLFMIPFMYIEGADTAVTVFAILGKALITISYSSAYVVTSETYPTDVRAVGMGVSSSFARFSSLISSFVGGIMTETWRPLPSVVFGVLGLASGSLAFLLPETKNRSLPSTVEEAENCGRVQSMDVNEVAVQLMTVTKVDSNDVMSNGNGHIAVDGTNETDSVGCADTEDDHIDRDHDV